MRISTRIAHGFLLLFLLSPTVRAQRPELVTQAGHADAVVSTAFNPDGSLYATGDASGIVKLWDTQGGRLLRTIAAHTGRASALAFSHDGSALASESKPGESNATSYADSTVKLWDVRTGRLLLKLDVGPFAFSPSAGIFAIGDGKAIKLWETRDGRQLRTLEGHALPLATLNFSPDGKLIGSTGAAAEEEFADGAGAAPAGQENKPAAPIEDRARLWEVESGKLLFELQGCAETRFSPDGSLVADSSGNLCETKTGRLLRGLGGDFAGISPDGSLVAFWELPLPSGGAPLDLYKTPATLVFADTRSGATRQRIGGLIHPLTNISGFSPDGRTVIISGTTGSETADNRVEVWDTTEWRLLHRQEGYALDAITPDAKYYTAWRPVKEDEMQTGLYETRSGKLLGLMAPTKNFSEGSVFSPDGRALAFTDIESATLYDVPALTPRHTFRGSAEYIPALAFSPDGRAFAVIRGNEDVSKQRYELWETSSGSPVGLLKSKPMGEDNLISYDWQRLGFTPDGRLLATADGQLRDARTGASVRGFAGTLAVGARTHAVATTSAVELRDAQTNRLLRRVAAPNIALIALNPSEKLFALGFGFGEIGARLNLFDAVTGKLIRQLEEVDDITSTLAFSPDGSLLAVTYGSGSGGYVTNAIYETASGRRLTTFYDDPESDEAAANKLHFLAFSPDSKLVVLQGHAPNTVELRDAATGRLFKTIEGVTPYAQSAAFSADGKILATGDADTAIRFWSTESGELLAALLSFETGDWLAVSPDGLFDGSPAAWGKMLWRFSADTFQVAPAEMFFNEFYYPGLLSDILAGRRPRAAEGIADKDRRQPRVRLEMAGGGNAGAQASAARTVSLRLKIEQAGPDATRERGSGAQDVRLFRNGSLVRAWRGDVLQGQSETMLEATVTVVAGENRFTAYAFSRDQIKSADARLEIRGANSLRRKGTAHILSVGVNAYANSQYDLRYAVADAREFSEQVRREQERLGRYARVEVTPLYDAEATKANVLRAIKELAAKVEPEDAVVVFFAGHGTAHESRFYLLPHDIGYTGARVSLDRAGLETILAHSISDRELEEAFEGIDAGQILFVIDACNSGQALESEEKRRGPMNSKGLAQLAYEKGMYILTAAQSFQAAQEASQLGHGLLTYALIEEGLKQGAGDREPRDGSVLCARVARLRGGARSRHATDGDEACALHAATTSHSPKRSALSK